MLESRQRQGLFLKRGFMWSTFQEKRAQSHIEDKICRISLMHLIIPICTDKWYSKCWFGLCIYWSALLTFVCMYLDSQQSEAVCKGSFLLSSLFRNKHLWNNLWKRIYLNTVNSGNSKRLNSKQSLISKHFCWNWAIVS